MLHYNKDNKLTLPGNHDQTGGIDINHPSMMLGSTSYSVSANDNFEGYTSTNNLKEARSNPNKTIINSQVKPLKGVGSDVGERYPMNEIYDGKV